MMNEIAFCTLDEEIFELSQMDTEELKILQ